MPQMSPMMWLNLMIYFTMTFILINFMIYNLIMNMNSIQKSNFLKKKNYFNKW